MADWVGDALLLPLSNAHCLCVTTLPPPLLPHCLPPLPPHCPLLPGLKVQQNNGPVAGQTVPQLHFHVIPCFTPQQPPQPSSGLSEADSGGSGAPINQETVSELPEAVASERPALSESMAGPLVARLRNLFVPLGYGRPNSFHAWAGSAEEMERLGASMQVWGHYCRCGGVDAGMGCFTI